MGEQLPAFSAQGIHCIDTGLVRPGFDAAWLVVEQGRAAFIDCGTSHAVPAMLQALARLGLGPEAVDWLILTHVHLDHAGGAGALLAHLPHARVLVHPRGAPHLIDPSRLVAGATAVYGAEEMARSYGQVLPIDPARVHCASDGQSIDLAGRALLCIDTPGHARHHLCVFDARSRSWFTGDTFGISYRELDGPHGHFIIPTTSPVQFEPGPLKHSIGRMLALQPQAMHLTHYASVGQVERLGQQLLEQIDAMVAIAREQAQGDAQTLEQRLFDALSGYYAGRAEQAGLSTAQVLPLLAIDIRLNAQGLVCWLQRGLD
jgi:Zn-dependent hydrolases, including glyoxylases